MSLTHKIFYAFRIVIEKYNETRCLKEFLKLETKSNGQNIIFLLKCNHHVKKLLVSNIFH